MEFCLFFRMSVDPWSEQATYSVDCQKRAASQMMSNWRGRLQSHIRSGSSFLDTRIVLRLQDQALFGKNVATQRREMYTKPCRKSPR